jgi:hypothetical protein
MSSGNHSARADALATTRTLPCTPLANSLSSTCMRSMAASTSRACRSRVWPAAVGSMPQRPRSRSGVPKACSMAPMRLLTAEATSASRAAARAMLRSSHTAMKSLRVTGSKVRLLMGDGSGWV